MIKFFRKIRYNLMSENKTGKYLKYAIGEIVLVMVGILLALQVNNWNEQRKDANLEKYYLDRLVDDLNADITEIDSTVSFANQAIYLGNEILKKLELDYSKDLTVIKAIKGNEEANHIRFIQNALKQNSIELANENIGQALGFLYDERLVDMYDATYQELVSTGNLEVIRDTHIREELSSYYLSFKAVLDIQDNLLYSIDAYNKALLNSSIPIVNTLDLEEVKSKIDANNSELVVALKNLIYNHAYAISLFQYEYRPLCNEMISNIKTYSKTLN